MSDFTFDGFEPANTTPVPDVLFDILLPNLSGAELKVLLYIIRRTWGFKKDSDAISFKQFLKGIITKEGKQLDHGCGISNRTVLSKALTDLESKGCIKTTKGKDPSGDNAVSLYSIHFKGTDVVSKPYHPSQGSIETVPPVVSKPYHGSNQSVPGVVSKPYPQETVIQPDSLQETVLQEGTGNVAHRELPTPAPDASQNKPYKSDGNDGHSCNPALGESHEPDPSHREDNHAAANPGSDSVARVERPASVELSTLTGSSPQASAKVEPKPGNSSSKTVASGKRIIPATAQVKPQLTLLGGQVREWYEIIRACRLRLTANNVNALNALGEEDGMTFENLKDVLDLHDSDQWVKDHNIPIGPQELADEKSKWRFERWKPVVMRNRQKAAPAKSVSSLPSYHAMSDAEYYASLRGGTHVRSTHAR